MLSQEGSAQISHLVIQSNNSPLLVAIANKESSVMHIALPLDVVRLLEQLVSNSRDRYSFVQNGLLISYHILIPRVS